MRKSIRTLVEFGKRPVEATERWANVVNFSGAQPE
jgi:hypothetical protein